MFGLDKALKLPAEIAGETAKAAAQLPAVPLDVADAAVKGLEEGVDRATDPDRKGFGK